MLHTVQLRTRLCLSERQSPLHVLGVALLMAVPLDLRIPLPSVAPSEAARSEEHSSQPTANHNKILSHYPLFVPALPDMLGVYPALPESPLM